MTEQDDLMGGMAAARYLGVARSLVYRWHGQGRLPGYTIGGHLFFRRADLDAFKAQPRPTGVNVNPKEERRPLKEVTPA